MSSTEIKVLNDRADPRLAEVQKLFVRMYLEESAMGSQVKLARDGDAQWVRGVAAGLERFNRLTVASSDGMIVGFAHGAVRLQPDYLGAGTIGTITHVFVVPDHRKRGLARQLVASLDWWFTNKAVQRVELTVLAHNPNGVAFWEACGFQRSLVHMSKTS